MTPIADTGTGNLTVDPGLLSVPSLLIISARFKDINPTNFDPPAPSTSWRCPIYSRAGRQRPDLSQPGRPPFGGVAAGTVSTSSSKTQQQVSISNDTSVPRRSTAITRVLSAAGFTKLIKLPG